MTVLFVNIDIGHFPPLFANAGFVNDDYRLRSANAITAHSQCAKALIACRQSFNRVPPKL